MPTSTVTSIASEVATEADAYRYLERLRWRDTGPFCAHCDATDVYLIAPKNGVSRATRTGAPSERRVWRCRSCNRQFSVLTGTIMHGTKVSVRVWVLVIFEMCAAKNGVSAREIERKYGLCPRTAWFMLHRLREAMRNDGPLRPMRGVVVADETWIGGEPKNRHPRQRVGSKQGKTDKTPVLSLINDATGEARSKVVPDVRGVTLRKVVAEQTDMARTTMHTDTASTYPQFASELAGHAMVNHKAGEYVRRGVSTNLAEGYFSQLKRSVDGTHHHVSREHLHRYLAEFDFRYTTCKNSDAGRMRLLMGKAERRLTYKRVTG